MSNVLVIIKMCYVHNQWYDISCATLYFTARLTKTEKLRNGLSFITIFSQFVVKIRLQAN